MEGASGDSSLPVISSNNKPRDQVDVCVFIDPLHDFLSPDGIFCKTFGEDDCAPILSVRAELNDLYCHLKSNCPTVDIVVVSSVYQPTQFAVVPNLCTTPAGSRVVLEGCPVDENIPVLRNHTFVQKTDNFLFSCSQPSLERMRSLFVNRSVMVCGVTTVSCVSAAVSKLCHGATCKNIIVARNAVASRQSNAVKEAEQFLDWQDHRENQSQNKVHVCDFWQNLRFGDT